MFKGWLKKPLRMISDIRLAEAYWIAPATVPTICSLIETDKCPPVLNELQPPPGVCRAHAAGQPLSLWGLSSCGMGTNPLFERCDYCSLAALRFFGRAGVRHPERLPRKQAHDASAQYRLPEPNWHETIMIDLWLMTNAW